MPDRTLRPITVWWDWFLVLTLTPVAILLTSFIINDFVDPFDEGLHYLSYSLYEAGKIPYVDFYPLFPPIWTYANIVIEKIFGEYLLTQRLWFVFQANVVVVACYVISRKFCSKRLLALSVIGLVVLFGLHPFWLPRWSGVRLAVYIGFLLLYMRHMERTEEGAYMQLFFLGFLTGISNLFALDVGIHITAIGAAMIIVSFFTTEVKKRENSALKLFFCLAGFLLPLIIWAAYLAYYGSLFNYISTYYYVYMIQLMPISTEILSGGAVTSRHNKLRIVMLLIFLVLLIAGLLYSVIYKGFVKKDLSSRWRVLVMAMLMSFIVSVSTLRAATGTQYQMFALIPIFLWVGFVVDRLTSYLSNIISGWPRRGIRVSMVVILFILFVASYIATASETARKINAVRSNVAIAKFFYRGDAGPDINASDVPQLAYLANGSFAPGGRMDALINYLSSHTQPDEAVLAFPMYVEIIPSLAGRHSATSYPISILIMGSPERQLEYIREIEAEKPRYAVFFPSAKFGGVEPLEPYFKPVYRYLRDHYRPAVDFPKGEYQQIWVRIDERE